MFYGLWIKKYKIKICNKIPESFKTYPNMYMKKLHNKPYYSMNKFNIFIAIYFLYIASWISNVSHLTDGRDPALKIILWYIHELYM